MTPEESVLAKTMIMENERLSSLGRSKYLSGLTKGERPHINANRWAATCKTARHQWTRLRVIQRLKQGTFT